MTAAETEWEPGDPLFTPAPNSRYFFNFRDEFNLTDSCRCGDAAHWPEPSPNRRLEEDPLAEFIAGYHAWASKNVLPEEDAA